MANPATPDAPTTYIGPAEPNHHLTVHAPSGPATLLTLQGVWPLLAELTGRPLSYHMVRWYRDQGQLPDPVWTVGRSQIWLRSQFNGWSLEESSRPA